MRLRPALIAVAIDQPRQHLFAIQLRDDRGVVGFTLLMRQNEGFGSGHCKKRPRNGEQLPVDVVGAGVDLRCGFQK